MSRFCLDSKRNIKEELEQEKVFWVKRTSGERIGAVVTKKKKALEDRIRKKYRKCWVD